MSFDPASVLNRIRSKKKLEKSNDSGAHSPAEPSAIDVSAERLDKSRDRAVTNQTLHIMAEQIRYMQDHIKRLESSLDTAQLEIARLKEENRILTQKPALESYTRPVSSKVSQVFAKKPSEAFGSRSPLTSKQKSIDSISKKDTTTAENSHRDVSSYFNLYVSGQSQRTDDLSHPCHFSTAGHHSNARSDLSTIGSSIKPDLKLHILEKILSTDSKMAVPQLRIVF